MELTAQCNLKCTMCWQNGDLRHDTKGLMDDDLFKRVIDQGVAAGMRAIKLQSRGESMLHPRLAELAEYAKQAGVMDVQLTTNGTLFNKEGRLEAVLKSGMDKLIFSMDPQHDESALEIYGDKAPDVPAIVREAFEIKKTLGLEKPIIRIQTIAQEGETKEDGLVRVKREYPDADEIMVNHLWNSKSDEDAYEGLSGGFELMPCSYLWSRLVVFWDGEVALCCRDYNNFHRIGNVKGSTIKDIWLGEKMAILRQQHLDGERHEVEICKHCDECVRPLDESEWRQMLLAKA